MPIYTLDQTSYGPAVDFNSAVRYRAFPVKVVCPECPVNECDCPCPNDAAGGGYLVASGDKIFLQFFFEDLINANPEIPALGWYESGNPDWFVQLNVYDMNDNALLPPGDGIEHIADAWSVWHNGTNSVQQVVLDVDQLVKKLGLSDLGCFYFCVKFKTPKWEEFETVQLVTVGLPKTTGYLAGQVILSGLNFYQLIGGTWTLIGGLAPGAIVYESSTGQWYTNSAGAITKIPRPEVASEDPADEVRCCTRTYKLVRCEGTVQVCGSRTSGKDCRGYVYGRPTNGVGSGDSSYRFCTRVPGSFEPIAYPIDRKISEDGVVIRGGYSERARLRTDGICRTDAEDIASILSSEDFTIDGESFDTVSDVEKNNDEGSLWYLDVTVERTICDGKNDCDFSFE